MSLVWKKSEKRGNYEETNRWNAKITHGEKSQWEKEVHRAIASDHTLPPKRKYA